MLHDDLDRAGPLHERMLRDVRRRHPRAELRQRRPSAGAAAARREEPLRAAARADGVLLGINKEAEFAEAKVALQRGRHRRLLHRRHHRDARRAGALFGVDRLGETVTAHRGDDPEALVAAVLAARDRFADAARREDDLTIVAMKLTK